MRPIVLETDLLKVFVSVTDRGGFTKAAHALNRTQSAVSQQIKRLESAVGTALFRRDGKRVLLTSAGESLVAYARRILALNDEAVGALAADGVAGTVRLGCIEDYAMRALPRILAQFWRSNPAVLVEVQTGLTANLIDRLGRDFELVVGMHPVGLGRGEVVCRDTLAWATSRTHSVHLERPLPLALYGEGCLVRRWATASLDEMKQPWRCAYLSPSLATVEAAVESGLAVSVFKRSTASRRLKTLTRRDGFPRLPDVDITLHTAPGGLTRPASALADHLCKSLRAWHRG